MLIWRLFQNHRRYVKSRDDNQLLGLIDAEPSNECDPFVKNKEENKNYIPCGAIANSMFSGKTMKSFNLNKKKPVFENLQNKFETTVVTMYYMLGQ